MIFSVKGHIDQIIAETKTQTRRVYHPGRSHNYEEGKTYSIQIKRGMQGIIDGRIYIIRRWFEAKGDFISVHDAEAEGGYLPIPYEELFKKMHGNWQTRQCLEFQFVNGSTKYCEDCGSPLLHKRGTCTWGCPNPECNIWSQKFNKRGDLVKINRVAIPRENPLQIDFDIIGEM